MIYACSDSTMCNLSTGCLSKRFFIIVGVLPKPIVTGLGQIVWENTGLKGYGWGEDAEAR